MFTRGGATPHIRDPYARPHFQRGESGISRQLSTTSYKRVARQQPSRRPKKDSVAKMAWEGLSTMVVSFCSCMHTIIHGQCTLFLVNAYTGVILNMNVYSIQRGQPKSKRKPQPHSRSFAPASLSSVADDVPDEILGGDDVFFDVATPTSPMVNLFFCDLLIKIPLSEVCFRAVPFKSIEGGRNALFSKDPIQCKKNLT